MKCRLDPQTSPDQKLEKFNDAMRSIMQVSKDDLNRMLAEEKIANQGKPKRGPNHGKPRY
jgi:hypothetical protein